MTGPVEAALLAAEEAGRVLLLDSVGTLDEVSREVIELAHTAAAPMAARALVDAVERDPDRWAVVVTAFASGVQEQNSRLALLDTIDVMLARSEAARRAAPALHEALLSAHSQFSADDPLLAAAALEGALRIALAGTVQPYSVLGRLATVDVDAAEEYLEEIARLIGIALDRWDEAAELTAHLVAALEVLRDVDVVAADAIHELARRQMRAALREPDPDAASAGLSAAGEQFAEVVSLDEDRDDAVVYAAVCSAVAAFAAGSVDRLRHATTELLEVVPRRVAWHQRMHQPAWRRPIVDAEVEWLGLVIDLQTAADRLAEPSWLESAAAVGQLARAYSAERSTAPAAGLTAIVRPAIENAVAENAVLLDQLSRTVLADRDREMRRLPGGADLLLDVIEERRTQGRPRGRSDDNDADEEDDPATGERIKLLAPRLWLLGEDLALRVAQRADDSELAQIGLLVAAATASGVVNHPALGRLRERIVNELDTNPAFEGETRAMVIALLDTTLTFLHNRYDQGGPVWPGHLDICRKLAKHEEPPVEADLQREFYIWVATSHAFAGRASLEERNIARGRVDVLVRMGDIQLVTEVKRELADSSRGSLERHVPQASAYAGSNVPFSQLLVLDLTEHTAGVPPLQDLAWVIERRVNDDSSPQHVIAEIVVGNRTPPSGLKET